MTYIANITLLVRDYDEAIAFYSRLGFRVVEDIPKPELGTRWVTIRPPHPENISAEPCAESSGEEVKKESASGLGSVSPRETTILLARPSNAEQEAFVGNQTGGKVFLILATDNFEREFKRFSEMGVEWVGPRRSESYGEVAVWKDLYGNLWDLIQHR